MLETLCINWERQCAKGELLHVRQRSVCDIKKRKAAITHCDLTATILLKLVDLNLVALNFAQ